MKKKILPVIAAAALIVILAAILIVGKVVDKYIPTDERMDSAEYYGITGEGQVPVILQDEVAPEQSMLVEGVPYLNYHTVKDSLNSRFYWDSTNQLMLYTTPTDVIKIPAGSAEYTVSGEEKSFDQIIVRLEGETPYIEADFVKQYTNMTYETLQEPDRILVTYKWGTIQQAKVKRDEDVRYQGGVKSPILTEVSKGDLVTVLEQLENWTKVATADGYIGYVRNKKLGSVKETTISNEFTEPEYTRIRKDYTINLVWHQISNMDSNYALSTDIESMTGVNTISPTWFSVASKDGTISSLADASYVETAHEKGLEVWGLVDNFNQEVDMKEVLTNTTAREKLTDQLIEAALEYQLDGLNIDFENLGEELGDAYIEFLRELSVQCRKNGLVLSSDNTVPRDFSSYYQRGEQAEVVDYFIIMGYDEHWHGSKDPGSVASISYVSGGLDRTLQEVPANKVVNALPFYTILWKTEGTDVTDEYITMNNEADFMSRAGVTAEWDEETCQNYAEWTSGNATYQIWLEDAESIAVKLNMMATKNIGGVAVWRLGYGTQAAWELINAYLQ